MATPIQGCEKGICQSRVGLNYRYKGAHHSRSPLSLHLARSFGELGLQADAGSDADCAAGVSVWIRLRFQLAFQLSRSVAVNCSRVAELSPRSFLGGRVCACTRGCVCEFVWFGFFGKIKTPLRVLRKIMNSGQTKKHEKFCGPETL